MKQCIAILISALSLLGCDNRPSEADKLQIMNAKAREAYVSAYKYEEAGDFFSAYEAYKRITNDYASSEVSVDAIEKIQSMKGEVSAFNVVYKPLEYPQRTREELIESILKGLSNKEYSYLFAHLLIVESQKNKSKHRRQSAYDKSVSSFEEAPEEFKIAFYNGLKSIKDTGEKPKETKLGKGFSIMTVYENKPNEIILKIEESNGRLFLVAQK